MKQLWTSPEERTVIAMLLGAIFHAAHIIAKDKTTPQKSIKEGEVFMKALEQRINS